MTDLRAVRDPRASHGNFKMDLHESALNSLLSLARRRGSLTLEDLQKALPVNSMTEQEIAHVLARLDEAGFDVAIDPAELLPDNARATKGVAPIAEHDETEPSDPLPGERHQQASPPASAGAPDPKPPAAPHSGLVASAPMLPWILAFAIVVLVAFAAFAFRSGQ